MKKVLLRRLFGMIAFIAFANVASAQGVIISEIADGPGTGGYPKYVEITNATAGDFVLDGYIIKQYNNGGTAAGVEDTIVSLTLPAGASYVVTNMDNTTAGQLWTDYNLVAPTYVKHGSGINANGDDVYELADPSGVRVDVYGELGTDGTGLAWEFLDTYAYRVSSIENPNTTFTIGEWVIAPINTLDGQAADLTPFLTPGTHTIISGPNPEANIASFTLPEQAGNAVIDTAAATVAIEVLNGTALTALTPTIGVSYNATISPLSGVIQDFTNPVTYTVTAEATNIKIWTVTVTEAAPLQVVSIYDIQYTIDPSGDSPYNLQQLITNGIVTATMTGGYWIQDGAGAWNGIFVSDAVNTPTIGDSLTISGIVGEPYGQTEIAAVTVYTLNSSGNTLPAATSILTADMGELYESVYIICETAECINTNAGFGMWTINNGGMPADSLHTDDIIFAFTPVLSEVYDVTGIGNYSYSEFKILPRDANDVIVSGTAGTQANIVSFSFAEQTGPANINLGAQTVTIEVAQGTNLTALVPTITMSTGATINPLSGVAQDFTNPFVYTVTASDAITTKDWTVTVTEYVPGAATSIYDIQYTTDPSGDSPYLLQNVTTGGIVAAVWAEGYWLQEGSGPWTGIYVFDSVNTPTIGDSVVIECSVDEFYNLTELENVTAYNVVSSANVVPITVITSVEAGTEDYESVFVQVVNAPCTNANAGFGMWEINDGSGPVLVDDVLYSFTPTLSTSYDVSGVVYYSYSEWKILPRMTDDVIISGTAGQQAEIATFVLAEQVAPATINSGLATVLVEVTMGTNLTALVPTITVSSGATISPLSGVAQDFTNPVVYTVTATDGLTTKDWTVTVVEDLPAPTVSIYDIQYTTNPSGDSPYLLQEVETGGIVTAIGAEGYWLQAGSGPWSGIYTFDIVNTPSIGDSVVITCSVDEFYNLTELEMVTAYTLVSSANTVTSALINNSDVGLEEYESVLVQAVNAECVNANAGFGMWGINNDGTLDTALVDDVLYQFTPTLGVFYDVTGVVYYSYSEWKILPRMASDVIVTGTQDQQAEIISFSFAEQTSPAIVNSGAAMVVIEVAQGTNFNGLVPTITLSAGATINPLSGVAQDFTTPFVYTVTAADAITTKDWTINVMEEGSTTSIYDIQYTADVSGDSPYNGMQVTTVGIVTATKTDAYWIQDGSGPWNGIYVFDNTNTPAIGDSITISCSVTEFYNLTELESVTSYTLHSSGNALPETIIATGDAPAEAYESVLVSVSSAACTNSDAGFGMWEINDGSGAVLVDDDLYSYTPTIALSYDVTGLVYYSYSEWKILPRIASDVIESGTQDQQAEIVTFSMAEQSSPAIINSGAAMIVIEVAQGTNFNGLVPTITVSAGASISPASGVAQDFSTSFVYTVTAADAITTKDWTVNVMEEGSTTSIYDIQYTADVSGDSPFNGMQVTTVGIVTAITTDAYWLQDGSGPWNGVYVYDYMNTPSIGDSITISCSVTEFYDLTELQSVTSYTLHSTGNPLPETIVVTGNAPAEAYESVLVSITSAPCTNADAGYGMWEINDGSGAVLIDDDLYSYTPTIALNYDVTGLVYYSYSEWKILPRNANDVIETGTGNQQAEIISFSLADQTGPALINSANATVFVMVTDGINLNGLVPTITVSSGATISPNSGVSQDFTSNVAYTVTAADGSTTKDWTAIVVYDAPVTIYDIQYTTDVSGDSPLNGLEVTTSGIVTATTNAGYYIQDGTGAWNGVYVFDYDNTPARGDSITITATVDEYNSLTELVYVSSYTLNSTVNTLPAATSIATNAMAELYEGVLCVALDAQCVNVDAGFGQWVINNGASIGDTLYVDDPLYSYSPVLDVNYDVTGLGDYSFGFWKILPRDAGDVYASGTANQQAEITSFVLGQQTLPAVINSVEATVFVEVSAGTNLTALVPNITISSGATISPASGIAQNFTNAVTYMVTSADASVTKEWTVNVYEYHLTTITEIQKTSAPNGNSPFMGVVVHTKGIVTAVRDSSAYWIQDGDSIWSGVYVYDNENYPQIGDSISITATADEHYSLTELKWVDVFTTLSSGNPVTPVDVATGNASFEAYEGVFVKVSNSICTALPDNYGEWLVDDGSGEVSIDDGILQVYTPLMYGLYEIRGVVDYYYNFKIMPRDINDIILLGIDEHEALANIHYYPNPVSEVLNIEIEGDVNRIVISNVIGQQVFTAEVTESLNTINFSEFNRGVYMVSFYNDQTHVTTQRIIKK